MFENVGSAELLVVLIIVLIFFGPKRIPELARSFGKGMRKFNDAKRGFEREVRTVMKEPLDSINEAKTSLERQMKETGDPIREILNEPVVPASHTPQFTPPVGSLPRGATFSVAETHEAATDPVAAPASTTVPSDSESPSLPEQKPEAQS
jgi:sec-independent protein translocase protein TatA